MQTMINRWWAVLWVRIVVLVFLAMGGLFTVLALVTGDSTALMSGLAIVVIPLAFILIRRYNWRGLIWTAVAITGVAVAFNIRTLDFWGVILWGTWLAVALTMVFVTSRPRQWGWLGALVTTVLLIWLGIHFWGVASRWWQTPAKQEAAKQTPTPPVQTGVPSPATTGATPTVTQVTISGSEAVERVAQAVAVAAQANQRVAELQLKMLEKQATTEVEDETEAALRKQRESDPEVKRLRKIAPLIIK